MSRSLELERSAPVAKLMMNNRKVLQYPMLPEALSTWKRASKRGFIIAVCVAITGITERSAGEMTTSVFEGPPAAYSEPLITSGATSGVLRTFSVEERAGIERRHNLVRVPLFFGQNECPTLDDLAIMAETGVQSADTQIPWQADDIRHGPDGGVSRVHLWFTIDLKPLEKKSFRLVRRTQRSRTTESVISLSESGEELRIETDLGPAVWTRTGALRSLPSRSGAWSFDQEGAFPNATLRFTSATGGATREVVLNRSTSNRSVQWASGTLFAKVRVRLTGPDEILLEQTYRVPRDGSELVVSQAVFPGQSPDGKLIDRAFLEGSVAATTGEPITIEQIPAGVRYPLRAEHAYSVTALRQSSGRPAVIAIPLVVGATNGIWTTGPNRTFVLTAQEAARGDEGEKQTLYGWWSEVRLVPVSAGDALQMWSTYLQHVQPLVAIVEEPDATVDRLHAALKTLVSEMKPIGWRQEAGRAWVQGDVKRVEKILAEAPIGKGQDRENLVRGARNARAKLTQNGARVLREDEKGRALAALDPYHITYTQSAAAALATLTSASPAVNAANLAMASGVRAEGGRVDAAGNPYIDVFNRTLNMQLGPVLFGLTAGAAAADRPLVRFYRDLATSPPAQAVFGRGQRPYTGAPAVTPEQTDFLYQSICDFWLRATELLASEDLQLHRLAFGRYTDCIDVMADRYHGVAAQDKTGATGGARANFFRGQAHTHRWLGWSCAPFIRLLEEPSEKGRIGLTEAIHHAETMKGRWKNWPDLTYYVLADMLVREGFTRYQRPVLPNAPAPPLVDFKASGAVLTWRAVDGAAEYRVFRSDSPGGPYQWLNSPYVTSPSRPLVEPTYRDAGARRGASYLVLSVDAAGRQSPWPERVQNNQQ